MVFKLPLLIRTIKYHEKTGRPRQFLLSNYKLISSLDGVFCYMIFQGKGIGMPRAKVDRHERAFVRFIKANYGDGEYSIVMCRGRHGFKLFWRGIIEKDRFIRLKGKMSPYIISETPIKNWHNLKALSIDEI